MAHGYLRFINTLNLKFVGSGATNGTHEAFNKCVNE